MCGICGLIGPGIIAKDLEVFTDLMWANGLRGPHSTGLFVVTPGGPYKKEKFRMKRSLGHSVDFLMNDSRNKIENRMIRSMFSQLFMAHSRWATKGEITVSNAHPFDTGTLVSCHNGTLTDKEYQDKRMTDSELMFRDMEDRGIKAVLEDLDWGSAYAISSYNKRTNILTLARNSQRPLFFGVSKSRAVMYYASELEALDFVASRNGISLNRYEVDPDTMIQFDISKVSSSSTFWNTTDIDTSKQGFYEISKSNKTNTGVGTEDTPWNEEFCLSCGSILVGDEINRADKTTFRNETYYTCRQCVAGEGGVDCTAV